MSSHWPLCIPLHRIILFPLLVFVVAAVHWGRAGHDYRLKARISRSKRQTTIQATGMSDEGHAYLLKQPAVVSSLARSVARTRTADQDASEQRTFSTCCVCVCVCFGAMCLCVHLHTALLNNNKQLHKWVVIMVYMH